ncbi:hypothetical protein TWF103_005027 [Orbilia oligospora]|nr:hypothetical protein TWF103_005027 [Orbilia oligospora]
MNTYRSENDDKILRGAAEAALVWIYSFLDVLTGRNILALDFESYNAQLLNCPEHPGRYKEYKPIVHAGFENHKLADPRNVRVTAVQQRYLRSAATSIIGTWINALADMVHHAPGFP